MKNKELIELLEAMYRHRYMECPEGESSDGYEKRVLRGEGFKVAMDEIKNSSYNWIGSATIANQLAREIEKPYTCYMVLEQEWLESEEGKNGWEAEGWGEPDGFELIEILDTDKHDHPTKGRFEYVFKSV